MTHATFPFAAAALAFLLTACAAHVNPSFPITDQQARAALDDMRDHPRPLVRPLVIVGGLYDPNLSPLLYSSRIRALVADGKIIRVAEGFCGSFDDCRRKIIAAVDAECPSHDPLFTTEVDVIGVSLGGLAARYAAAPSDVASQPRRLRIARLFTIASPLAGSVVAQHLPFYPLLRDLAPGSPFLCRLADEDAKASYQLFSYVDLHDEIVGARFAAPPGKTAYWLDNPPLTFAHAMAVLDPRIEADIARHLRDEPAFVKPPPAPLPQ